MFFGSTLKRLWCEYWEALTLTGYEQGFKDGVREAQKALRMGPKG